MKPLAGIFLCAVLLIAVTGCNQGADKQVKPAPETKPAPQTEAAQPVTKAAGTLTEEEIGKFINKWKDPKTGQEWMFSSGFANQKPRPETGKTVSAADANKISYRITCRTSCTKEVNGKNTTSLVTDGSCTFYITDSSGNVVAEPRTEPLKKLCPS